MNLRRLLPIFIVFMLIFIISCSNTMHYPKLNKKDVEFQNLKESGIQSMEKDKLTEAIEYFNNAIIIKPDSEIDKYLDDCFYERGEYFYSVNRIDEAMEDLKKCTNNHSKAVMFIKNLGIQSTQKDELTEAIKHFYNTLLLEPDTEVDKYLDDCFYERGEYFYSVNRIDEAMEDLKKCTNNHLKAYYLRLLIENNINFKDVNFKEIQDTYLTGKYYGNKYINSFLGISFSIPSNWNIASKDNILKLFNISFDYFQINSNTQEEFIKEIGNNNIIYCTFISKYPLGYSDRFNSSLIFGCEKIPDNYNFTANDYLEESKKFLLETDSGYTFSEITTENIDNITFLKMNSNLRLSSKTELKSTIQDHYVVLRDNYFIFFISTYSSDTDKQTLNEVISSINISER